MLNIATLWRASYTYPRSIMRASSSLKCSTSLEIMGQVKYSFNINLVTVYRAPERPVQSLILFDIILFPHNNVSIPGSNNHRKANLFTTNTGTLHFQVDFLLKRNSILLSSMTTPQWSTLFPPPLRLVYAPLPWLTSLLWHTTTSLRGAELL